MLFGYKRNRTTDYSSLPLLHSSVCVRFIALAVTEYNLCMNTCSECSSIFKNSRSLASHRYRFHPGMSSNKLNTIAIVDPNRSHPLSNGDGIRKRNLSKILHSTSGESSDSDSSMDSSDDEVQTKKPKWIKLSEDDKARIRKHNQSSIDSDSTMGSDSNDDEADTKKPRRVRLPDNNIACS